MRILSLLLLLVSLGPLAAHAETLAISSQLFMEFQLPSSRWTFSHQPPEMLIASTMANVEHDLKAKNRTLAREQVLAIARKQLAQNQGFVYDPQSESYLLIDFSPLKSGEKPPSDDDIEASAKYAVQDLQSEPHVTDVQAHISSAEIEGAQSASRLDATYLQGGQSKAFTGLIGYVHPYWIFLYYTDTGKDPRDAKEMAMLLKSIRLHGGKDHH